MHISTPYVRTLPNKDLIRVFQSEHMPTYIAMGAILWLCVAVLLATG